MKIIVPMAGRGSRLRPLTLTTPKPLVKLAGKPIVQWLIEDIAKVFNNEVEEIAFIIGDFGTDAELKLEEIAESIGAKASIYHQVEALGTAHAILCAKDSLEGEVVVAFADTLFRANFDIDKSKDATIWVKKVKDPSAFGVIKVNDDNIITDFIEKPEEFVSDLAIIGIYYFKSGENLKDELQYLIDNDIKDKGEYQLTNALENMKAKGLQMIPGEVREWLDCGNRKALVYSNRRVIEMHSEEFDNDRSQFTENVSIIEPCYIGKNVEIINSEIGPFVTIEDNATLENCLVRNSIIYHDVEIKNMRCTKSVFGEHAKINGSGKEWNVSAYTERIGNPKEQE